MNPVVVLVVAVLAVVALAVVWFTSWRAAVRRFGHDTKPAVVHEVETSDGWRLGVDHHLPEGERRGVVVTCHGLGANRFNLDLMPGLSVVERLVGEGWEVFNVDLRGNGRSSGTAPAGRVANRWNFDDHVRYDVPAILDHALRHTGVSSVHWVGHSMGGMVMYAHLGRVPADPRVASVVAVASPVGLEPGLVVRVAGGVGRAIARTGLTVPAHLPGRAVAPFAFAAPVDLMVAWPPNLTTPSIRRMLVRLIEPLSPAMVEQFTRWIGDGSFTSEDGTEDYEAALGNVVTPMCFIVGPRDRLAPPASVRNAHDRVSSDVREYWHVGRAEGARTDHCHGSILLGESAPDEVYPLITGWLDDREAGRGPRDTSLAPWLDTGDQATSRRSAMRSARNRAVAAAAE